jgi:WD40 repeat protein
MERLRQAGWLVSDMVVTTDSGSEWVVLGHRGDNRIQAQGTGRDEAWWQACRQALEAETVAPEPLAEVAASLESSPSGREEESTAGSAEELLRLAGARYWVECVAVSPDGRWVATGSGQPLQAEEGDPDFSVRIWDIQTGKELRRFLGHSHWVMSVAFSPDGRRVLSGSYDNSVRLWDLDTGNLLHRLTGHTERVRSVAYSPDGRYALSGSYDKTMRLWDLASGHPVHCYTGHAHWVMSVAFSPDGRRALSAGYDQSVRLWDVEMDVRSQGGQGAGWLRRIWQLWGLRSRRELCRLLGHQGNVTSVAFSPDCGQALSGSMDRTVCLWHLATRKQVCRLEGHTRGVMSVAFSPNGRRALSGGMDDLVFLWDLATGEKLYRYEGHGDVVTSVTFTPDGSQALTGSADKTVRLWKLPR